MARPAGTDRMSMDIRAELKKAAVKGGRYFTGTARMFLDSTVETVGNTMPTVGAMLEANRDLVNDTLRFLRNPVDALNRGMDRLSGDENIKALKKFGADAWDDLKTGNIYDPNRDRSSFGTSIDSLLDNFGDVDMSGFDESGDYTEVDTSSSVKDAKMLESHEQADDARTIATIDAVQGTGSAIIANAKGDAQTSLRLGIRQHSQLMGGMSNIIAQQGSLLDSVNAMASSLLEVQRETHRDIMTSLREISDSLTVIRTNTGPAQAEDVGPTMDEDIYGSHGAIDIRKWLASVKKNADNKYNISSTLSMATMGMSPKQLIELVADNPLKLISDHLVSKAIPEYLKTTMETTQKYMENFFPSLLTKWADQGRRFDKDPSEGGGRLIDLLAGIFGVQPKKASSLDLRPQNILEKATFTNKTATAIEEVMPMWLSKIYSAISGSPLSMYNYSTGEVQTVAKIVADTHHKANDLVGRMGSGARTFMDRATDRNAFQFEDPEMEKKWESYLYRFMQKAAEEGRLINHKKSREDFMDMMPDDENKDLWYRMITATISHMPRSELMSMNAEISRARSAQVQSNANLVKDIKASGLGITQSMLDPRLKDSLEEKTMRQRYGLSDDDLIKAADENLKRSQGTVYGLLSTNKYLDDITSMLRRGIVTYTHLIGDERGGKRRRRGPGGSADPTSPIDDIINRVQSDARDETDRIIRYQTRIGDNRRFNDNRRIETIERNQQAHAGEVTPNKVWIGRNHEIDQMVFDQAQGSLAIRRTADGESDSTMTEEQRMRQANLRGLMDGQVRRVKDVFGGKGGGGSLVKKFGEVMESPFKLVDLGLRTVDQFLFKMIYGEDAPQDLDDPDNPEKDPKAQSLMDTMTRKMKAQWASTKLWFKEYIGDPIKEFFLGEQGLLGKVKNRMLDGMINPAAKKISEYKEKAKSRLFGTREVIEKYVDDPDNPGQKKLIKEQGDYTGGLFSSALNRVGALKKDAKSRGMSYMDSFMYGDAAGKRAKGRSYIADDIELDENGNQVITEGHYAYHGAVGEVRKVIDSAKSTMWQWLFGQDEFGNDFDSTKKFEDVKAEVKKAFPDMTIGAGVGLIGSFFLPGGPIVGSLLGATGGLVAGSDRLKDYLFGEQEDNHATTRYNMKTGQIETVRGKGRKGNIIPAEMIDAFKKFAPKMAIGAGLGVVGSMFLPGGPVIGAILGATGGMTAASDKLKQVIFGDGTDEDNGIISPKMRKSIIDAVKKNAPGVLGGGIAGAKLGSMLGAGLGLIPGLSLLPTGPIFTMLGGITGAIGGNTIQEFFFGQEEEVEVKDEKTGKVKKVKKRVGGLFGKAYDYAHDHLFKSFGEGLSSVGKKVQNWFDSDVVGPLAHVAAPLKEAMEKTKTDIQDAFHNMGQHIKDSLDRTFENAFGKKMGEFFEEKIKKPMSNMVGKILGGVGKAIGAVISAPFKLLDFMVTGNTSKLDAKGNVLDDTLDSVISIVEKKTRKPKPAKEPKPKKDKTNRPGMLQRFLNWRDRGTEEVNENMRSAKRYYDKDETESSTSQSATETGTVTATAKPVKTGPIEKLQGKLDRVGTETEKAVTVPVDKRAATEKPATVGQATTSTTTDQKELKAKLPKTPAVKKDAMEAARARGVEASKTEDVKKASKKGKSATEYLRSIDRTLKSIYKEMKGQLNGVGYNIAYIKLQFDKHLGKLKSDELPENMEGSTSGKLRKRRGFFGKAIDAVTGFGDSVRNKAADLKDAAIEKVKGTADMLIKPFKLLGRAATTATKAVGAFGKGLFSILGKLAKGMAEGLAGIFKGAGELLGKTLGGIGKMIWKAGAGIGRAFGNTVALVSDVVKNFGSAVAAGIAGVCKVAATVVPDIATGIWKGVTKTAGAMVKGVKWAGGKVAGGAKWLFNKITGKGKKDGSESAKATAKISETISNGYMAIGIGNRKDVQPYPYVNYAKGILTKVLNSTAIPVWIMGSSVPLRTRPDKPETPDETPSQSNRSANTKTTDMPTTNAEKKSLVANTEPKRKSTSEVQTKTKARKPKSDKPAVKQSQMEEMRQEAKAHAKETRKARDKFRIWKRGYKKVDSKAERSKNPGNVYDAAIDRAGTMEEAEGIIAASSMNGNALGSLFARGAEEKKEDEGGGLMDMFSNLLGGDNGVVKKLAEKFLPKSVTKFFGNAKGIGKSIGGTVMRNLPFIAGTAMALHNGETDRVVTNVAKQVTGKGMKWLGKSATEAAVATVEGTAAKGLGAKAAKGFSSILGKFLGNKTVQAAIKKFSPKMFEKVSGKGAGELTKEFTKRAAMSLGSEAVQKLASKLNIITLVATAVWDFVSGMGNVGQYFEISDADATLGMKLTSGLCKAISGFCFGLLPVGWLSRTIYGWFAGEKGRSELEKKQDAMSQKVAQYNRENGTTYSVSEYAKTFDDKGNKRGFWNSIKSGFASAGTAIGSAWDGIKSGVSKGASWIGEHASNLGKSVALGVSNGAKAVGNFLSKGAENVTGFVKNLGANAYNFATSTVPYALGYAGKRAGLFFTEDIPNIAKTIGEKVQETYKGIVDGVGAIKDNTVKFVTETIPNWTSNAIEGAKSFGEGIVNKWNGFWGGVGNFFTDTLPGLGEKLKTGWGEFWSGIGDKWNGFWSNAGDTIKNGIEDLKAGAKEKIDNLKQSAKDLVTNAKEGVANAVEGVKNKAADIAGDVSNWWSNLTNNVAEKFNAGAAAAEADHGKGPVSYLGGETASIDKNARSGKASFLSTALEMGRGVADKMLDFLRDVYKKPTKILDIFAKVGEGVGNKLFPKDADTQGNNMVQAVQHSVTTAITGEDPVTGKKVASSSGGGGIISKVRDTVNNVTNWVSDKLSGLFDKDKGDESGTGHWGTGVHPMSQTDAKWNKSSGDMAKVGCGPTAAAMVASAYGKKSTPAEADWLSKASGMRASDGGTNPKFFNEYARNKGFGMSEGPASSSAIMSNVSKGKPVVLMGKGGAYGNNTHYMVADRVSGNGNLGIVDPIGGTRKNVPMDNIAKHTSKAVYSYGKGPVSAAVPDGGGSASNDAEEKKRSIESGQQAVVNQMLWLKDNPIKYSLSGAQDPDKGSASCASTVGWAYRKAFGLSGMSASSTEQSKNDNFETIWTNDGSGLDTSILKPGDVLYMNWGQTKNTGAMKHTEMYAGNNKDLSHGGPGAGPVYKDLNDYRRKHTMMVRRYKPLISGDDVRVLNSRGGGFGALAGGAAGASFGSFGPSITRDANGNAKFALDASGNISFLSNLTEFFGNISSKLSTALGTLMGIRDESTADTGDGTSNSGTSSGGTKTDASFTPVTGGTVQGTDYSAKAYNFLRGVGLSKFAASGVMGNLDAESGINPGNVQNGTYAKNLSNLEEDKKYIEDVNSGAHDFVRDSKGYGIAQWTYWSRKQGLLDLIKQQNAKLDDIHPQLQHLWNEINSYNLAGPLNNAKSVKEASDIMLHDYEAPADQSAKVEQYRASLSQKWYDKYAENETPDPEATDDSAAKPAQTDDETATAWGAGPGGLSLGLDALNTTVANMNRVLSARNAELNNDTTASVITKKITDSISSVSGTGSDALMQAMVASMSQMVELLTKIANNTEKDNKPDPLNGGKSSPKDKPRITQYPSASPLSENGMSHPTAVGAEIVDKMTANRR